VRFFAVVNALIEHILINGKSDFAGDLYTIYAHS